MTFYVMGIDPGVSGAVAVLNDKGDVVVLEKLNEPKPLYAMQWPDPISYALIEQVGAHRVHGRQQGGTSMFTFGESFGLAQGLLLHLGLEYDLIRPQRWQNLVRCKTGGDKNVSKACAQALFPEHKVIHATADALLIASLALRHYKGVTSD